MGLRARWYWTDEDLEILARMARERAPTRRIADRLGRSPHSVRCKASQLQIPLPSFGTKRALTRLEARGVAKEYARYSRGAIRVTADFDISALSPEERLTLAARCLGLALDGKQPSELPPAYDAVVEARARRVAQAAAEREARKANGGTSPKRKKRSREERFKRREAGREKGLKRWMSEEKFADYLNTWREKEYVRDMLND